jgi:twinkle protein
MSSSAGMSDVDLKDSPQKLKDQLALEWLEKERHLSRETLAKMPVATGTATFHNGSSRAIFFAYPDGWKARAFPEKAFTQKKNTSQCFWNLEAVLNGPLEEVYIVEGELDACALVESGIPHDRVLSAPSATVGEMKYVFDALDSGLNKAKRFIWCGDQDDPGLALRAAMAKAFGTAKFYYLDWPEGTKDANAHLKSDGKESVHDLVMYGILEWPSLGLYRMNKIPDPAPITKWHPGFETWGDRLFLAPGTLSVVTGHPGHGKTMLFSQIWFQIMREYNLTACVASFETRAKPHLRRLLRTLYARKLETVLYEDIYQKELEEADQWINDHYLFLLHPDRKPELKWLLDQAEIAVVRHRAKIVVVDPWNRLESERDTREPETEYIGRCLKAIYNFAVDFNVHVQIMAHPAKTDSHRRGLVPELEDISGSKNWENMVDQGFVIHRPSLFADDGKRETYAELHHKKARFEELGYATKFALDYDIGLGRYGPCELTKRRKKTAATPAAEEPGTDDD